MDAAVVHALEDRLRVACSALDPDAVPLPDAVGIFGALDRIARLAAGAKLRLLRRVDEANVAGSGGDRSTAEWVARATGVAAGAARDALETSRRLGNQPAVDAAVSSGELSEDQVRLVTDAAAVDPHAETALVDAARRCGMRELRQLCAETKANVHEDALARREAIRRNRCLRTYRDLDGAWNLHVRHLPEVGAEIEALLAPFTHHRFEAARQSDERERREAYAADALLDMARSSGAAPKGACRAETKVLVHVDIDTLVRGSTLPGSVCRVEGVGPVDVEWVRAIYGEAFAAAVLEDAVGVRSVVHLGRQVTAHQRTALEARGYRCEVPGCGATYGLQIDHVDDWAVTRRTVLDDLAWLCVHHHRLKTRRQFDLSGPPGNRTWTPARSRASPCPAR
jgi:hypothetical protein